jgi:hypothetical protein
MLQLGGESYPENAYEFYAPVIEWVRTFLDTQSPAVTMRIALSYLNTSSTKQMIDILDLLENAHEKGAEVSVEWYYDPENERAQDTIEEFREDYSMPFAVVPHEEYNHE